MKAFIYHLSLELKNTWRNPSLLFVAFLFPLGFYLLVSSFMTAVNPGYKEIALPAMVAFAILSTALLSLPSQLVEAREAGIFRAFTINGISNVSIIAIPAVASALQGIVISLVICLSAQPLFGAALPLQWGWLVGIATIFSFCLNGLAALIGAVAGNGRIAIMLAQMVFLPSMLIGGLMVPMDALPELMRRCAGLLPSSQAMQAFSAIAYGHQASFGLFACLSLAITGIIAFTLATILIKGGSSFRNRLIHPVLAVLVLVPGLAYLLWS